MSPNPIPEQLFSLQLDEPLEAVIKLFTAEGRTIPFERVTSEEGSLQLKFEQKLPAGIYILSVEERSQYRRHRVVIE